MQSGQNAAGHPALEEGAGPGLGLQPRGLSTLLGCTGLCAAAGSTSSMLACLGHYSHILTFAFT